MFLKKENNEKEIKLNPFKRTFLFNSVIAVNVDQSVYTHAHTQWNKNGMKWSTKAEFLSFVSFEIN